MPSRPWRLDQGRHRRANNDLPDTLARVANEVSPPHCDGLFILCPADRELSNAGPAGGFISHQAVEFRFVNQESASLDLFFIVVNPEPARCDNRNIKLGRARKTMASSKRRTQTAAEAMNCNSLENLSVRYAELLRLRKAVREAETKVREPACKHGRLEDNPL